MKNIKEYGAIGNGLKDDFPAINKALENESELLFPKGRYVISQTLYIPSDRKLVFEEGAVLKLRSKKKCRRGDFLLSNKNTKDGDKNIEIIGATFDGNNGFFRHKRSLDIFKKDGYSGILINFCNVKNLILYHTEETYGKDRKKYYTEEGKNNFNGNIIVPDELEVIEIK